MTLSDLPELKLKPGREASLAAGHPWIFSGALAEREASPGQLARVLSSDGKPLALAFCLSGSIAAKVLSFSLSRPQSSVKEVLSLSLQSAWSLREQLGLHSDPHTSGFRLFHAEGDGIPELIIDVFGPLWVLQVQGEGALGSLDLIIEVLEGEFEGRFESLYLKMLPHLEEQRSSEWLRGEPASAEFFENGVPYELSPESAQKTGFFFDQRLNRAQLSRYSQGKSVLDLFSHVGGFGLNALRGGASRVLCVDRSAALPEFFSTSLRKLEAEDRGEFLVSEVKPFLAECEERFDIVVLDPPAFVKHRKALKQGLRGYESLNRAAVGRVKEGGLFATFSCSQLVGRDEFESTVIRALGSSAASKNARLLSRFSQAPCHPRAMVHKEGEYLKGLLFRL